MSKAKTQHLFSMFHENFQVIDLLILISADVKKKKKKKHISEQPGEPQDDAVRGEVQ